MNIILNEKKFAEKCLTSGQILDKPYNTIKILASYFYYVIGYNEQRIEVELVGFMERSTQKYRDNVRYWHPIIEDVSKHAGDYKLHEIDGVWITQKELTDIEKIESAKLRNVAFVLLCLAKFMNERYSKNNGWVNYAHIEIFKLAKYNCTHKERCFAIGEIYRAGLIELPVKITNTSLRVAFIDETAGSNETDIFVDDFRELGYMYQKINGDNIFSCRGCGILVKNNHRNNRMYCSECAGQVPIQYKSVVCSDCGNVFVRPIRARQKRCPKCHAIEKRRKNRINMRKWRKGKSNIS